MKVFSANPYLFVFIIIVIVVMVVYIGFLVIDRLGLEVSPSSAVVTGKQYTVGGTTYNTNVAGGRTWVQSTQTPETYAITVNVGGENTVGLVSKAMFDTINANDTVQIKYQRTRITKRLFVIEVSK